jgi:hypothetical protein
VEIKLPGAFEVDEIPDAVEIESLCGKYRASWKMAGDTLHFEHVLEVFDVDAPASASAEVRGFFEKIHGTQHRAVVLVKP